MTNEFRVVVDTNTYISAMLFPGSTPSRAIDLVDRAGTMLVSSELIQELKEVARRSKFDKYVAKLKRLKFVANVVQRAELFEPTETINECRDPKDNKFLELAVSGNASHIITGDADLLVMNPFRGIAIVSPQEFLESVEGTQP